LVYINGNVEGDISVYRLSLGPSAIVFGNVTCQQIEMSSSAKFTGQLNVSPTIVIPGDSEEESKDLISEQL
jgi:cytoskeletal protein CcmA (bactofilin family)